MKIHTAKTLELAGLVLGLLCFLLSEVLSSKLLIVIGLVPCIAGWTIWLIFGRCQKCGKWLGRHTCEYCPHCGEKTE